MGCLGTGTSDLVLIHPIDELNLTLLCIWGGGGGGGGKFNPPPPPPPPHSPTPPVGFFLITFFSLKLRA